MSTPRGCHRGVFLVKALACLRSATGCTCIDEPGPWNVSWAIGISSVLFLIFASFFPLIPLLGFGNFVPARFVARFCKLFINIPNFEQDLFSSGPSAVVF